jgi:4-amino-4-deoxy-L-arabinose transferase-like glycosyltransferase
LRLVELLVLAAVFVGGLLATTVAVSHAIYLGFDFDYFYPAAVAGALIVILAYGVGRIRGSVSGLGDSKQLLLIVLLGGILRMVMLSNSNASAGDEAYFALVTIRNNPFNIVPFTQNFRQIADVFGGVTTPLTFFLDRIGVSLQPTLQGARIVPFLLNVTLIPVVYYLAKEFASEEVSRTTALLYAINPASLFFLGSAETDIFLFFFAMTGLLFFVRGYRKGSAKDIALSILLFGGAFWSKASLAELWICVPVLFGIVFLGKKGRLKKLAVLAIVVTISVGLFLPWSAVSPASFYTEFISTPRAVATPFFTLAGFQLGGSGTVVTTRTSVSTLTSTIVTVTGETTVTHTIIATTVAQTNSNPFAVPSLIPLFNSGNGEFTSVLDVYTQIPLWFGPVSLLVGLCFLLYALAKKQDRGLHVAMLLWILLILVAMLTPSRDVRYFVDFATFPVLFLAAEVVDIGRKQLARGLEVLIVLFAVVFLVIGVVVGYQITGGIAESSQFVNQSFHNPSVGVNNNGFMVFLSPNDNVSGIPFDAASLNTTLNTHHYDVVLIWQQSRTYFIPADYQAVLQTHYRDNITFGPSSFSYVTVYYNYT